MLLSLITLASAHTGSGPHLHADGFAVVLLWLAMAAVWGAAAWRSAPVGARG
jgi:hypothetical protein